MVFNYPDFKNKTNIYIKKDLKQKWETWDKEFFKKRDKKRFIVSRFRIRNIITEYGCIPVKRHVYFDKIKKDFISFTDKYINIDKNKRICNELNNNIINEIAKSKSYKNILDLFANSGISLMTISNIFKKTKLQRKELEKIKLKEDEYLYVNLDDTFINLKNQQRAAQKYKVRIISCSTGLSKGKYRKMLSNKRVDFILSKNKNYISSSKLISYIRESINNYYELGPTNKLIIGGDGATWIKNVAYQLKAPFVLDRYHAIKYLRDVFLRNKRDFKNYYKARALFYQGESFKLQEFLIDNTYKSEIISYFANNDISNQSEKWNIGVSAESDVSHLVKSLKGYGSKIFNYQTFNNMLIARANIINTRDL